MLPLDIMRLIRAYLPLNGAHRFRRVSRDFRDFKPYELEILYASISADELIGRGDLLGFKYLCEHKGNKVVSSFMETAAFNGQLHCVRYIHSMLGDINMDLYLILAACKGYVPILRYLIEEVNVDPRTIDDEALMMAIYFGCLPAVIYLVEKGAVMNAQDGEALIVAIEGGHWDVIEYVLNGADFSLATIERAREIARVEGDARLERFDEILVRRRK